MEKWPIGVFASIDAGLGVHLEVGKSWACPRYSSMRPMLTTATPGRPTSF